MSALTTGFDYSVLPADVASFAREVASRVRSRHQATVAGLIETGKDLILMKERLGHGNFLRWIEDEFQMSDQSARNYMNAADAFGSKSKTVLDLPPTVVYALAAPSTPEPVRQSVFAKYEAGERIEASAVKIMVREARAAEKPRRLVQTREDRQRSDRSRQRREDKLEKERQERMQREREAAAAVVAFLQESLGAKFSRFLELMSETNAYRLAEALKAEM